MGGTRFLVFFIGEPFFFLVFFLIVFAETVVESIESWSGRSRPSLVSGSNQSDFLSWIGVPLVTIGVEASESLAEAGRDSEDKLVFSGELSISTIEYISS